MGEKDSQPSGNRTVPDVQSPEADYLLSEHTFLRAVFDLLPVGVWLINEDGKIVYGNSAGRQIWAGARYVELPQYGEYRAWYAGTTKEIAPEDWAAARAITKGEATLDEELEIQCFDGTRKTIRNWAIPIRSDDGGVIGAVAVNQDVTLARQESEIRDSWLGIIAHDLRHPLSTILLQAQMLSRRLDPENRKAHSSINHIEQSVYLMDRLTEDILATTMLATGRLELKTEPVDVDAWLATLAERLRDQAAPHELQLVADRDLGRAQFDPERIEQVLANLVSNAVKYGASEAPVVLDARGSSKDLQLSVLNAGEPIPEASQKLIFERFQRLSTTGPTKGAGLGLFIARGIAEGHGGSLEVDSKPGSLTKFTLQLPRKAG